MTGRPAEPAELVASVTKGRAPANDHRVAHEGSRENTPQVAEMTSVRLEV